MLALRLLAIVGLFALSTIPFAVAENDNESHPMSEGPQEEGAEGPGAEGPGAEVPGDEGEEEHID